MTEQFSEPKGPRFVALDGWRGVCAVIVALHHCHAAGYIEGLPLLRNAFLFVDFFFVLSGFVLAHAYRDRLATMEGAATMLWRRFARLWPLHAVTLLAMIALELAFETVSYFDPPRSLSRRLRCSLRRLAPGNSDEPPSHSRPRPAPPPDVELPELEHQHGNVDICPVGRAHAGQSRPLRAGGLRAFGCRPRRRRHEPSPPVPGCRLRPRLFPLHLRLLRRATRPTGCLRFAPVDCPGRRSSRFCAPRQLQSMSRCWERRRGPMRRRS